MSGNQSNKVFYHKVPLEVFQALTKDGGFDRCLDLELIKEQVFPTATVLEVGAGYGRCIDFLLAHAHQGVIHAVEQSTSLVEVLKEKYAAQGQVKIHATDIQALALPEKVDVVFWLFSGMLDFSKEEQPQLLKLLRVFLKDKGMLFLDIPQLAELTIAKYTGSQDIVMETPYGNIVTYIPSFPEMEDYARQAGFAKVTVTPYETATGKKRSMYRLDASDE